MQNHRQQFSAGLFLLLLLAFHSVIVDGFKSGAPANTCWTLYPKHHGTATQTTRCPFLISPSSATYVPGQEITVTIAEPSGKTFSGFQLGVYRDNADKGYTAEVVGQFTEVPADKVKTFTCFPGYKNMATHTNLNQVDEVVLKWTAPTKNLGNLVLRGTIVANFSTFWTRVERRLPVDNSVILPVSESVYQVTPIAPIVKNVQFSECGNTKGCFLYPRHCTGDDCVSAVSYMYRPATDDFLFEMYSDAAKNYISVGFSDDRFMGHEETITCASNEGEMSVQHGWNPHYHNERLLTRYLSNTEVKHADGRLQCRFILERMTEVYKIDQGASSLQYSNTTLDHKQPSYLQLAWGKTMPESVVISYHKEMPTTTTSMVDLTETTVHRGSSFHVLVQAHGAIMMIAWILLAGLVTIVSRHFRNLLPRTRWFGTKVWFQVHRGLAISITVFTAIGLTLIFAHYGAEIREESIPHSYVGLAMTVALAVEVTAGLLRPGPASKYRVYYNWGHRCLGQIAHILAAVTMFLAYDIEYVTPTLRKFGFITLGIWICVQVLWCIGLEVLKWRREAAAGNGNSDGAESKEYDATCDLILIGLYSVTMATLCVACLLAFLLF